MKVIKIEKIKSAYSSLPDIDSDFASFGRGDVKSYIIRKYGKKQSCSIGTFGKLQVRAAIKDIGRQFGLSYEYLNFITRKIHGNEFKHLFAAVAKSKDVALFVKENPRLIKVISNVLALPKNSSVHPAGMIIVPKGKKLYDYVPVKWILNDSNKDNKFWEIVSEWEGEFIDKRGILKIDILGLKQLDIFFDIERLIKKRYKKNINFGKVVNEDLDNKKVLKEFSKGTEGVFQFKTFGLSSYMKQLKPDSFNDLVAANALYRPGPMESNTHKKYVDIKHGNEELKYDHKLLKSITKETYGLLVYQEQVMQSLITLGKLSLSEADEIRTMVKHFEKEKIVKFTKKFIKGAMENGCSKDEATMIWEKLLSFGSYGYNKCISGNMVVYKYNKNQFRKGEITVEEYYRMYKNSRSFKDKVKRQHHLGFIRYYDIKKKKISFKPLLDILFSGKKRCYRVKLKNGMFFEGSKEHRLKSENQEYIRIKNLWVGDRLIVCGDKFNGYYAEASEVVDIKDIGIKKTYDLVLDKPHNYIANGFVSHNSHSCSYSILAFYCQWLKVKYPLEFYEVNLNYAYEEQIVDFILRAKDFNIKIKYPDINISKNFFCSDIVINNRKEKKYIIWCLSKIKGLGGASANVIYDERRKNGKFKNIKDFFDRIDKKVINKQRFEILIYTGCFDKLFGIVDKKDRYNIFKYYYEELRSKHTKKKERYVGKQMSSFYYDLKMKEFLGIGNFINYDSLAKKMKVEYDNMVTYKDLPYGSDINFLGLIVNKKKFVTKKKDDMMVMYLDNNGLEEKLVLFPNVYNSKKDKFDNMQVGDVLYCSAKKEYDSYWGKSQLIANENSQFRIKKLEV